MQEGAHEGALTVGTHTQERVALLTDYDTNTIYSKAYQTLYTNISFDWERAQKKQLAILLTTPAAYRAHATVPANVAIAVAQNSIPTILVDADLDTASLQQRFAIGEHSGFCDLLAESTITPQKVASHLSKTFMADLFLLSAGSTSQPAPEVHRLLAARLASVLTGLRQFLANYQDRPGMIIFNSAPVLANVDAALISALVDQTFLLIATGQTTRAQAQKAQAQLERAHAKLAGIIMVDR